MDICGIKVQMSEGKYLFKAAHKICHFPATVIQVNSL